MKIAGEIIHIPGILKGVIIFICVMLIIHIVKNDEYSQVEQQADSQVEQQVKSTKKSKRHALIIYEIKTMPEGSRFKYEYITDAQTFWSGATYSIGDTLSFTTRKLKQQFIDLKNENVRLKADIARREKAWQSIRKNIQNELYQY